MRLLRPFNIFLDGESYFAEFASYNSIFQNFNRSKNNVPAINIFTNELKEFEEYMIYKNMKIVNIINSSKQKYE